VAKVPLTQLIDEYKLTNYTPDINMEESEVIYSELNRPALQITGFFDYFDSTRLQIIGLVEHTYANYLTPEERFARFDKIFSYNIPALIICRGLKPFPEMLECAALHNTPLLGSEEPTTDFMGEVVSWLRVQLAPTMSMHGVLVDIYGEGVLILGESGIGKSETALELIKRGHRLVADDAVEIKKVSQRTIFGSSPENIRFFIELRGVGIIDVVKLFGFESVKLTQNIDLVIKLENWNNEHAYDRLGDKNEFMDIMGINIVCHTIPIRPGRNLAIICESAAVNHRQKKMGYNAAEILMKRIFGE
jgi:HPr kinase/phosphorylase